VKKLLAAALALRLALMPATLHADILFIQYFPSFLSLHGVWDVYGHLGDTYLRHGFTYYPPLAYFLIGLFQILLIPLDPGFAEFMVRTDALMREGGRSIAVYLGSPEPALLRRVFLMKLPYLFADVLACAALWHAFAPDRRKKALRGWLFDPILIFSTYAFGQYRVLSAACWWVFFWALRSRRKHAAFVLAGAAACLENYPMLLLPPALMILGRGWRERTELALCFAVFPLLVVAPLAISSGGLVLHAYFSPVVVGAATQGMFVHAPGILPIALKTAFLLFYLFLFVRVCRAPGTLSDIERGRLFACTALAVLFALYATSVTMVHYVLWALPFWILARFDEGEPWVYPLSAAMVGFLFFFNLDSRAMNLGLLVPLDPVFFSSLPSLHEVMERFLPWGKFVALARLGFSVLCAYFAFSLYRARIRPRLGSVT